MHGWYADDFMYFVQAARLVSDDDPTAPIDDCNEDLSVSPSVVVIS
ncbi:MAG TPA: hypothetical protein VMF13_14990 [Luteitalea sp.]|nr:hypothetical protein [Luteitalea sp.]